jgi:hypothetical protein
MAPPVLRYRPILQRPCERSAGQFARARSRRAIVAVSVPANAAGPTGSTNGAGTSSGSEAIPRRLESGDLDERFSRARPAFSAPRFKALYRTWKQDGDVRAGPHAAGSDLGVQLSTAMVPMA